MPRMRANDCARYSQKTVSSYFRDFQTVEIRFARLQENLFQGLANIFSSECAKHRRLHFFRQAPTVPSRASNFLVQVRTCERLKHSPSSRVRLAFQIERPHDERPIFDEDGSNLHCCHFSSLRYGFACWLNRSSLFRRPCGLRPCEMSSSQCPQLVVLGYHPAAAPDSS